MCIWYSYVYQKDVLCFLIDKSYVRSIERYCFVRKFAAIPVQFELFIFQYIIIIIINCSCHSVAVDLTLVQTKQIRINIHK